MENCLAGRKLLLTKCVAKCLYGAALLCFSLNVLCAGQAVDPESAQWTLKNNKIEITISAVGATFSRFELLGFESVNPFHALGHFLALDGFGSPSEEEKAAGLLFHGEASRQRFTVLTNKVNGGVHSLTLQAALPLAQETLTRRVEILDGENVAYVSNELQSALSIDRPISWAEHATVGVPFLEGDETIVDMPATSCRVREIKDRPDRSRLVFPSDFQWPFAPAKDGGAIDLRTTPSKVVALDLATCKMDPVRTLAYVTALQVKKRVLLGYVFRRDEYPWLMSWMNNSGDANAARGMEFSTQPFDISHRQTVNLAQLFGVPTFRWLPAKATIQSRFLMFYTSIPEGFKGVGDVVLEAGTLTISDRNGTQRIILRAAQELK